MVSSWEGSMGRFDLQPAENNDLGDVRRRTMERNSRKLIRMLEQDGWVLDRVNGDHHTFKHPERDVIVTVTHPRRDLPTGLVRRIYKLAGWRP
jgi:predicted RNA binding protein YcfA (HicA-like mRNA interferase family)